MNVARYARMLEYGSYALICLSGLSIIGTWIFNWKLCGLLFPSSIAQSEILAMPLAHRMLACAIDGVSVIIFVAGIVHIIMLSRFFAHGEFFSGTVIEQLYRLSKCA